MGSITNWLVGMDSLLVKLSFRLFHHCRLSDHIFPSINSTLIKLLYLRSILLENQIIFPSTNSTFIKLPYLRSILPEANYLVISLFYLNIKLLFPSVNSTSIKLPFCWSILPEGFPCQFCFKQIYFGCKSHTYSYIVIYDIYLNIWSNDDFQGQK